MQKHPESQQPLKSQLLLEQNNLDSILSQNIKKSQSENLFEEGEDLSLLEYTKSFIDVGWNWLKKNTWDEWMRDLDKKVDQTGKDTITFLQTKAQQAFFRTLGVASRRAKNRAETLSQGRELYKAFFREAKNVTSTTNDLVELIVKSKMFSEKQQTKVLLTIFHPEAKFNESQFRIF